MCRRLVCFCGCVFVCQLLNLDVVFDCLATVRREGMLSARFLEITGKWDCLYWVEGREWGKESSLDYVLTVCETVAFAL